MSEQSTKQRPRLYVTATAHLDTQWRWTYEDTLWRYLPETLEGNFRLFERFPGYTFSFEGAWRYMLIKEYLPAEYARLRGYIAAGRWFPCGSAVEAGDVNTVSPESLVRQFLLGNGFFRREFGVTSRDVFLPDCFGFGWALPSVAAHCGLHTFSTSKLEWGSSVGIPFNVGYWEGVDGNGLVALINPGQYSFPIREEALAHDAKWIERLDRVAESIGVGVDFKYFGLGDTGGAPDDQSVGRLCAALQDTAAPIEVISAPPDRLASELPPDAIARLPRHRGELLLIEHGAGTYTAHGMMKHLNRENEETARRAEMLAASAAILGLHPWPATALHEAWIRVLASQMHDILPGTSIPAAYELSWNDEYTALNLFRWVERDAAMALARGLAPSNGASGNESAEEWVAFNPWNHPWQGVINLPHAELGIVPTPVALGPHTIRRFTRATAGEGLAAGRLEHGADFFTNGRLTARFDKSGRLVSLIDSEAGGELLSGPVELQLLRTAPREWPAWTIIHDHLMAPPVTTQSAVDAPVRFKVDGHRATAHVQFELAGSTIQLVYTLDAWSDTLQVEAEVDWRTPGMLLKVAFPLAVSNPTAVYDLGLGVIERGNNHPRLHEVPSQQWVAVESPDGTRGVFVASADKYGWDKPNDQTIRLSLIHTPEPAGFRCYLTGVGYTDHFTEQAQLDFGVHRTRWTIGGFKQRWNQQGPNSVGTIVDRVAQSVHPPVAHALPESYPGAGPSARCLIDLPHPGMSVMALKMSEEIPGEVVLRVRETTGRAAASAPARLVAPVAAARAINGAEESLAAAASPAVRDGAVEVSVPAFSLSTIAARVAPPAEPFPARQLVPLALPWNLRGISPRENVMDGDIDGRGQSLPGDLLPAVVTSGGVPFQTGPRGYRAPNIVVPDGQELALPGQGGVLHLLLGSVGEEEDPEYLEVDAGLGYWLEVEAPPLFGPVGRWYHRRIHGVLTNDPGDLTAPWFRESRLGWVARHRHSRPAGGLLAFSPAHLYHGELVLPAGCKSVRLVADRRIRIAAATWEQTP